MKAQATGYREAIMINEKSLCCLTQINKQINAILMELHVAPVYARYSKRLIQPCDAECLHVMLIAYMKNLCFTTI